MKKLAFVLLALTGLGCATTAGRDASSVRVFEADGPVRPVGAPLIDGCRLVGSLASYNQQESERAADDPFRNERRESAGQGGNVLLVRSEPLVRRPNLECPSADRSPGCLAGSRSWYRVSFETHACSPEALRLLETRAEAATGREPLLSWKLASPRAGVQQVKTRILAMMQEGVGTEVIVAYVQGQRVRKLTADDIIDWKRAGIPEDVIRAAASK